MSVLIYQGLGSKWLIVAGVWFDVGRRVGGYTGGHTCLRALEIICSSAGCQFAVLKQLLACCTQLPSYQASGGPTVTGVYSF